MNCRPRFCRPALAVRAGPFAFLEVVVEDLGVVDYDAVEQAVELLGVDAVGALDLAVAPWGARLDVVVADAFVQDMPVEAGAELGPVEFLSGVKPGWMS